MTRTQLVDLLIRQARANGFAFRKWFERHTAVPWHRAEDAVAWLAQGERAHMLIFSHAFAQHFWRSGERLPFVVPQQTFERVMSDGETRRIVRRAHIRRSSRTDVWRYHLREMAAAAEPLRYIRRYLMVEDALTDSAIPGPGQDE